MKNAICLCIALLGMKVSHGQQIIFDMSAFGIKFGKLVVSKSQENDSTTLYTMNAKGYLKVLWMERNDETTYEVRYQNGMLQSSKFRQIESGKLKKWSDIVFDGSQYQINSYKGKKVFREKQYFSVMKLYFEHHKKLNKAFYEAEGDFATLTHKDDNSTEVKSSDGNRSIFFYQNGNVQAVEVFTAIANVHMKRTN